MKNVQRKQSQRSLPIKRLTKAFLVVTFLFFSSAESCLFQTENALKNALAQYAVSCHIPRKGCFSQRKELWRCLTPNTIRTLKSPVLNKSLSNHQTSITPERYDPTLYLAQAGVFSVFMNTMTTWSRFYSLSMDKEGWGEKGGRAHKYLLELFERLYAFLDVAPLQLRGSVSIWGINLAACLKNLQESNKLSFASLDIKPDAVAEAFHQQIKRLLSLCSDTSSFATDVESSLNSEDALRALSLYAVTFSDNKNKTHILSRYCSHSDVLACLTSGQHFPGSILDKQDEKSYLERAQQQSKKAHPDHINFFWQAMVAKLAKKIDLSD